MNMRSVLLTACVLMVTACAQHDHGRRSGQADRRQSSSTAMLFSPNGEPLTGGPMGARACIDVMSQWFTRVDGNHDGKLDRQEFMADAKVQFERMDLDHDGFITPDELSTFRAQFGGGGNEAPPQPNPAGVANAEPSRHHSHHDGGNSGAPGSRAPSSPVGSGADPVMSADTNLDFKVSREEFLNQAAGIFDRMDIDHDGVLGPAEVNRPCPAKPSSP